ncbi:P-loop NTPase family protein [Ancylobacter lacus]|uniref:chromosomal replication initiator DnaA n=1 Tax=Ancylobacter lacus TaxID=2579970 RepID=UPI001BCF6922|nr:chromosomal replication initiator DnaA [Ancylobacter lacus]MBS7540888.1 chromosomal replication initiator DnaA [Ancylobacter lacus]
MTAARQLPLDLPHPESRARADFLPGAGNERAVALIDSFPHWPARTVALVGPEGAGKSHLAAILAEETGAASMPAAKLDAAAVPGALAAGLLVLEDVDATLPDEAALFHLLNLVAEKDAFLLLTAREAPAALATRLATPDLASRLRAVPVVAVEPPDDALLGAVMLKLFADRQIVPDEGLVSYLLARVERSVVAVRDIVAALDREALALKRPLTRALASRLLRREADPDEAGEADA